MKNVFVKDLMQRDPVAARADMLLTELVGLIREHRYRALPVTDDDGCVIGVVSETDLFIKEHAVPFSTEKVPSLLGRMIDKEDFDRFEGTQRMTVGQVMSGRAVTVGEDATMEDLALLMCARHLAMVPVVRDGKLVGVARRGDVLEILYGR